MLIDLRDEIQLKLSKVAQDLTLMQRYLWMRTEQRDWHGVMDASADIRELITQQATLEWVLLRIKPEIQALERDE